MNNKNALCLFLKYFHAGKHNPIHSCVLERCLHVDGRCIRRWISELRREGHPICSGQTGYYYARTPEEIKDAETWLKKHQSPVPDSEEEIVCELVFCDLPITIRVHFLLEGGAE